MGIEWDQLETIQVKLRALEPYQRLQVLRLLLHLAEAIVDLKAMEKNTTVAVTMDMAEKIMVANVTTIMRDTTTAITEGTGVAETATEDPNPSMAKDS